MARRKCVSAAATAEAIAGVKDVIKTIERVAATAKLTPAETSEVVAVLQSRTGDVLVALRRALEVAELVEQAPLAGGDVNVPAS